MSQVASDDFRRAKRVNPFWRPWQSPTFLSANQIHQTEKNWNRRINRRIIKGPGWVRICKTCRQRCPKDQALCPTTAVLISIRDRVRPNSLLWITFRKEEGGRPYVARNESLKRRTLRKPAAKAMSHSGIVVWWINRFAACTRRVAAISLGLAPV